MGRALMLTLMGQWIMFMLHPEFVDAYRDPYIYHRSALWTIALPFALPVLNALMVVICVKGTTALAKTLYVLIVVIGLGTVLPYCVGVATMDDLNPDAWYAWTIGGMIGLPIIATIALVGVMNAHIEN